MSDISLLSKRGKNNTQTKGCRLFELETPHFMLFSSQGVRKIRPLYRKSVYFRREFSKNNLFHIWKHNHYHKFKLQNVYVSQTMYVLNWHLKPKENYILWKKTFNFASAKVKKCLDFICSSVTQMTSKHLFHMLDPKSSFSSNNRFTFSNLLLPPLHYH